MKLRLQKNILLHDQFREKTLIPDFQSLFEWLICLENPQFKTSVNRWQERKYFPRFLSLLCVDHLANRRSLFRSGGCCAHARPQRWQQAGCAASSSAALVVIAASSAGLRATLWAAVRIQTYKNWTKHFRRGNKETTPAKCPRWFGGV